jgi:hypothetical protein
MEFMPIRDRVGLSVDFEPKAMSQAPCPPLRPINTAVRGAFRVEADLRPHAGTPKNLAAPVQTTHLTGQWTRWLPGCFRVLFHPLLAVKKNVPT